MDIYNRKRGRSSPTVEDDTPVDVAAPPSVEEVSLSSKSLGPRERERARAALKELADRAVNQTELARELRVTQQTVSKALQPGTSIGVKLAMAVAKARGQALEEMLGGARLGALYRDLNGWESAAGEAVQRGAAPAAVAAVARWPASLPVEPMDWRLIVQLAAVWLMWAPADEREAEETADAQREAEALGRPNVDEALVRGSRRRGVKTP